MIGEESNTTIIEGDLMAEQAGRNRCMGKFDTNRKFHHSKGGSPGKL